jgi:hypothetical protein
MAPGDLRRFFHTAEDNLTRSKQLVTIGPESLDRTKARDRTASGDQFIR